MSEKAKATVQVEMTREEAIELIQASRSILTQVDRDPGDFLNRGILGAFLTKLREKL